MAHRQAETPLRIRVEPALESVPVAVGLMRRTRVYPALEESLGDLEDLAAQSGLEQQHRIGAGEALDLARPPQRLAAEQPEHRVAQVDRQDEVRGSTPRLGLQQRKTVFVAAEELAVPIDEFRPEIRQNRGGGGVEWRRAALDGAAPSDRRPAST